MTGGALMVTLVVANTTLTLLLALMIAVRKTRRDRRERRSEQRRSELQTFLRQQPERLAASLAGVSRDKGAQVDFLAALRGMPPAGDAAWREPARAAACVIGLDNGLARQTLARDPIARGLAALLLGQLALPGAADVIAPLLEDEDGDVRIAAADALSEIADDAAARSLVGALERGRIAPERVVERLAGSWAVPTLLEALQSTHGSSRVRAWMARALGLSNDRRAEPMLRTMLMTGSDEERISAARAMGTCGSTASAAALTDALVDGCAPVRAQAATAVGSLGLNGAATILERSLADSSWWVRANAAASLTSFGDPGVAALVRALGNPDRYARHRAAEALALSGHRPLRAAVTTGVAA